MTLLFIVVSKDGLLVYTGKLRSDVNKGNAKIIYLSDRDYFRILKKVGDYNLSGGIVYDAIIVECDEKSKADIVLTLK
jgi:hypothetical protein